MVATYPGRVKEFLVYSLLRLVVFVGALALVVGVWALVGGNDSVSVLGSIVLALLLSGIASYFLLDRQRQALARRVEARAAAASEALERRKAREDVD